MLMQVRYKGRGHWFSPPIVQYRDGIPTVSTTGPDIWPALGKTGSDSSIKPDTKTSEGWTATFDSLHDIYDLSTRRSSPLATYYRKHIRDTLKDLAQQGRRFGAVMMEPTCLGAGGMLFVDPLFQACLVEVVRASADIFGAPQGGAESYEETLAKMGERDASQWSGLPIVYDEGTSILAMSSVLPADMLWCLHGD
jgi:dethiobiotin synthetase/adenosylmethionine--8-amino-7-oxononanoate aminotransferase